MRPNRGHSLAMLSVGSAHGQVWVVEGARNSAEQTADDLGRVRRRLPKGADEHEREEQKEQRAAARMGVEGEVEVEGRICVHRKKCEGRWLPFFLSDGLGMSTGGLWETRV